MWHLHCNQTSRVGGFTVLRELVHPGMMFWSGLLLLYTAVVVPAQIFLWDYSEQCNTFPTLFVDVAVDSFFLVLELLEESIRITKLK